MVSSHHHLSHGQHQAKLHNSGHAKLHVFTHNFKNICSQIWGDGTIGKQIHTQELAYSISNSSMRVMNGVFPKHINFLLKKPLNIIKLPFNLDNTVAFGDPWMEASTLVGGRQLGNVIHSNRKFVLGGSGHLE